MYVCMYVCMYVYVSKYVSMYVCMYVRMYNFANQGSLSLDLAVVDDLDPLGGSDVRRVGQVDQHLGYRT